MADDHFDEIASTARQRLLGSLPQQAARLHLGAASLAGYRSARLTETLRFAAVDDYQIRQKADGADVLIRVRGSCDVATLAAQLSTALRFAGVPGGAARVVVVDKIPRSPLGKRLRFVPVRPGG